MTHTDIAVVGLGTMGSMALWHLSRHPDQKVLGIEQFGSVHAGGAYAGESRLFRVAAKEGRLYTPSLLRARELWQELEAESGRELLLPIGALSVGPAGHPDLETTAQSIDQYDLPHERLDADRLRQRYPQFHVDDDDIGVLDLLGGAVRPEAAVLSAQQRALANGAELLPDTGIVAIDHHADGVALTTGEGQVITARKAIVTGGPWTTRLIPDLTDLVRVTSYALMWFMPRHVEQFTPDRLPGFMRDLDDAHAFGVPTLDGFSLKICPHIDLPVVDRLEERATSLSREELQWAGEQAQRMMPDLVREPVRWSVHPESLTDDKKPVIDVVGEGRIVVATGMSGNGFKFAPVYGLAVTELAQTGTSTWAHPDFRIAAHRDRLQEATSAGPGTPT